MKQDCIDQELILIGGGGHCKSVIDVAESSGYKIKGILDVPELVGKKVLGYPVLGTDDLIGNFVKDCRFVLTLGQIKTVSLRKNLYERVKSLGGKFETIIAPTAHVSPHSIIGDGSVIMHNVVINSEVQIGTCCIINTLANIEHESVIEDFCHVSTGVMINGNCYIENSSFIGSGTVVNNGIRIVSNTVVASGSLVNKDILMCGIYAGSPVKKINM